MNNLQKWIIGEMIEHLQKMEGQGCYGCDLAFKMFENENVTGSYTCNAYEVGKWIKEYWDELSEVVEDYEFNYGELPTNPFKNSEVFQMQIILHMASSLVAKSDYIEEHWDEKLELTEETIEQIVSEWKACY